MLKRWRVNKLVVVTLVALLVLVSFLWVRSSSQPEDVAGIPWHRVINAFHNDNECESKKRYYEANNQYPGENLRCIYNNESAGDTWLLVY